MTEKIEENIQIISIDTLSLLKSLEIKKSLNTYRPIEIQFMALEDRFHSIIKYYYNLFIENRSCWCALLLLFGLLNAGIGVVINDPILFDQIMAFFISLALVLPCAFLNRSILWDLLHNFQVLFCVL